MGDLTLKNKAKIITEIILSVILIFIYYLSFFLENYRSAVFVFGIIYCVLFGVQLIMSLISLIRIELPWGITIIPTFMWLFQNDSVNSKYIIVDNPKGSDFALTLIAILAIVVITIWVIRWRTKEEDFKSYIISCLASIFMCFIFSVLVIVYGLFPIINYSFDTTETQIIEVTVIENVGNDILERSVFFDFHELYNIETTDDIQLNQISIDTDYKIDLNIRIPIMYRKGLFCEMYKVDYSYLDDAGY